jgi:hypothetical protein
LQEQEQILSYWTAEGGWHSELQLRNNLPAENLTVTPVLRGPDGSEVSLPAVIIQPQEVRNIDLRSVLDDYAPQFVGRYGSVALRYRGYDNGNLYAAVMVHDTGHPIAFHIDASSQDSTFDKDSREGIWWLPNSTAKDILVLTNQGSAPIELNLSVFDSTGKEVRQKVLLGARETSVYSVRQIVNSNQLQGSFGGIRVQALQHGGSLDTLHAIYDENAGFSALLKMFDRNPNAAIQDKDYAHTGVWTSHAPMLALTSPDPALNFPQGTVLQPQLLVRNASNRRVTARIRFVWREGEVSGKSAGPTLLLGPLETQRVDVAALQSKGTIPADAQWASVILTSDGPPDELFAVTSSYDTSLRYGAQTPFSDQLAATWMGGQWEVDQMHDSLITTSNGGTFSTTASFTLFYNQGKDSYELEQALQPDDQMWIDVGKLIRDQTPDMNGKILPADLTTGSYRIRDLEHRGIGTLSEGKLIYDKSFGHVAYGCGSCCGATSVYVSYDPFYTLLGPGSTNGVDENDSCGDIGISVSGYFYNWDTANHGIATTSVQGLHTGVSVGGTTSSTHGLVQMRGARGICIQGSQSPDGPTHVVSISLSVSPSLWFFGSGISQTFGLGSTQTTLTANGASGGSFAWSITNGAGKVSFASGSQQNSANTTVNSVTLYSANYSTSTNDVTVKISWTPANGSDPQSATSNLTVDSPYKLIPGTPSDMGIGSSCITAGTTGYSSQIPYTVQSFRGQNITGIYINESFTSDDTFQAPYEASNWPSIAVNPAVQIGATGFSDQICIGNVNGLLTPAPEVPQAPLSSAQVDHRNQSWSVGSSTSGQGVSVQTDTLQRYLDHGRHLSVMSPLPR